MKYSTVTTSSMIVLYSELFTPKVSHDPNTFLYVFCVDWVSTLCTSPKELKFVSVRQKYLVASFYMFEIEGMEWLSQEERS